MDYMLEESRCIRYRLVVSCIPRLCCWISISAELVILGYIVQRLDCMVCVHLVCRAVVNCWCPWISQ